MLIILVKIQKMGGVLLKKENLKQIEVLLV